MPPLRQILPLDRWNAVVITATTLLLVAVVYLDFITAWTMLLFYLLPLMMIAWLARGWWWLVMAVLATGLWYVTRVVSPPPDAIGETVGAAAWNTCVRLGILTVVGFLCARLRQFSRSPDSLSSSHDATGLLSATGL